MVDHLSRLIQEEELLPLKDNFPDEQLWAITQLGTPWFANIANYLVSRQVPSYLSKAQKDKLRSDAKYYIW